METRSETRLASKLQGIAATLRTVGWLSCWLQLLLGISAVFALGFALTGRNFSEGGSAGTGIGIFFAAGGILTLLFNTFLAFRCTRLARRLRQPDANLHPKKIEVSQVLRLGVIMGIVGMILTLMGGGASVGVLLAKSFARPQGLTVYDPQMMIRTVDVLVNAANLNGITGNLVGTIASLWLADRVGRS